MKENEEYIEGIGKVADAVNWNLIMQHATLEEKRLKGQCRLLGFSERQIKKAIKSFYQ